MGKNKVFDEIWGWADAGKEHAHIAAAVFGGYRKMATGKWYGANGGVPTTNAFANQQLWYTPLWVPHPVTLDRLSCEVTVVAASAATRLGLYGSTDTDEPGALILDAGTVDSSSGTGVKEITVSQRLPAGLYWLAGVNQGGTPTLRSIGNSSAPPVAGTTGGGSTGPNSYFQASVSGALPATATPGGASSGGVRVMTRIG